jgi:hypothetical protein
LNKWSLIISPLPSLLLRKDIVSYEGYDSEFKAVVGEEKISRLYNYLSVQSCGCSLYCSKSVASSPGTSDLRRDM